jgi:uncharacterized membrane protein
MSEIALLLMFGIGVTAGLRTMTAPAVVAWAVRIGWINLAGSRLAFMGSRWALALFTIGALMEYMVDLLPSTPARTTMGPLAARIFMGMLTGACVSTGAGMSLWVGVLIGAIGAVAGAFGGQHLRARLVRHLHIPDAAIAIPEDLVAVSLGLLCCFETLRFRVPLAEILAQMQSRWL